jgi:hypothetical protein
MAVSLKSEKAEELFLPGLVDPFAAVGHGQAKAVYGQGMRVSFSRDFPASSRHELLQNGPPDYQQANQRDDAQSDIGHIQPQCF